MAQIVGVKSPHKMQNIKEELALFVMLAAKHNIEADGNLHLAGFLVSKKDIYIYSVAGSDVNDPDVREGFAQFMAEKAKSLSARYAAVVHDAWWSRIDVEKLAALGLTPEQVGDMPSDKRREMFPPTEAIILTLIPRTGLPTVLAQHYDRHQDCIVFTKEENVSNAGGLQSRWLQIFPPSGDGN